jgi:peptide/nickel transport system permease protein
MFLVVTVSHFMLYLTGDPVLALVQTVAATPEQIDELRHEYGFDRPVLVQYADYVTDVARGDFGRSIRYAQPNLDLVMDRVPYTLVLAGAAMLLVLVVAIPLGIVAALYRNRLPDRLAVFFAVGGQSVPSFVLGPVLILVFAVWLGWLPAAGTGSWQHLVLPAIALAAYPMARVARMLRASMLETMSRDHVRTAESKGLSKTRVITRHVLRNSALPVLTILALQLQALLGGAVIVESIFGWPGVGQFAIQALSYNDLFLVQTIIVLSAAMTIAVNLGTDILYIRIDPRIQYT